VIDKLEKQKMKIEHYQEQKQLELKNKCSEIDQRYPSISPLSPISSQTKSLSEMEIKLKESEKKTLWQIDECQKIIVQKVNKEYVDSAN
jgi:hypothetical protein